LVDTNLILGKGDCSLPDLAVGGEREGRGNRGKGGGHMTQET